LLGDKSSAHVTEAKVRKFAEFRILAIPSLIRTLFPTKTVAKFGRFGMSLSQPGTQLASPGTIECRHFELGFFD